MDRSRTRSHDIVGDVLVLACARPNAECMLALAPRRPEPFGHGINIKGRVNIVNNLRYNGASGAGDKFVDMRPGRDGDRRGSEKETARQRGDRRGTTATRASIGRAAKRKIVRARETRRRERDATFRRYHKLPFGGWNFPRATVTRRVQSARKFVDMQSSFSLFRRFLSSASSATPQARMIRFFSFLSLSLCLSLSLSFLSLGPRSRANEFASERTGPNFGTSEPVRLFPGSEVAHRDCGYVRAVFADVSPQVETPRYHRNGTIVHLHGNGENGTQR